MFRKILGAAALMLAVHGGALAQSLNEGQVLGNFSPTAGPAVPTDLTGRSGFGLFGNGAGAAPSYQGYLAYTTPRTWQSKAGDFVNVMDYAADNGCVPGDYSTSCQAAFNAAILAVRNYSQSRDDTLSFSGTVHVPASAGCFRITAPIIMQKGISLVGEGGLGSCILADDTDALHYSFQAGYGQPQVSNIFLYGCKWNGSGCSAPTAARTAIMRLQGTAPGSADAANRMLGLAIQNTLIWQFDTAIDVTTVGNLWITNSYFQRVNTCVTARGFSFGVRLQGVQCTRDVNGDGLGPRGDAVVAVPYNYTDAVFPLTPAGIIGPEAIEINNSDILDFANGITLDVANVVFVTNSTVQARTSAIRFKDVGLGLHITGNYLLVTGDAVQAAIFGQGDADKVNQIVNIRDNVLEWAGPSGTSNGIQINEPGLFGVHDVNIVNNRTVNFTGRDLIVYGPNRVTVEGNNFGSTVPATSIEFTSAAGSGNFITRNTTAAAIVANGADITGGIVRKCDNVVAGVSEPCSWAVTVDDTQTLSNKTFVAPALGSPSSVGTLPAFTLGGTVSGGGNQINNVVIGASTPLAVTGTAITANTSITSPIHAAAGSLTFQTNGTTAGIINSGRHWAIGTQPPIASLTPLLDLNSTSAATAFPNSVAPGLRFSTAEPQRILRCRATEQAATHTARLWRRVHRLRRPRCRPAPSSTH